MPFATTGPGPSIEPPCALTPFPLSKSRFVSKVQTIAPVLLSYARTAPSAEPANTAPGIEVTAADCAALHPGPLTQTGAGGAVYHARLPVARLTACKPPGAGES